MQNEMSESMDKKSFLMLAAYIAESVTDNAMINHFLTSIKKYQKEKESGASNEKLEKIFMEITLLSYVNVIRMMDKKAADLIKDIDNIDRVFDLINPNKN